jgi:hypothetical protein
MGYGMQAPVTRAGTGKGRKTLSGILAIVGAVLVLVACAVPYVKFTIGSHAQSVSLFNPGPDAPGAEYWFVVEPVGVIILAIVGGALIIASSGRARRRAIAAGALTVLGIQTVFLFAGYAFGNGGDGNQTGPAGYIGIVAALLVIASGIIGLTAKDDEEHAQASGANGPTASPGTSAPTYQPPYPGPGYP